MHDKDTTPPEKITCTTCGKTDVPDWNGKGQCITCARDAVLGTAQPPVVADKELDEILTAYAQNAILSGISVGKHSIEAKAALLQREQRLVAAAERAARIDENTKWRDETLDTSSGDVRATIWSVRFDDRLAQLRHNTNTGRDE
ncbi:MAG TPA: hypothetical protein VFL85_04955 [Candidatus Saccharimonadales bacterium]|nr:hypothetical protein [Candidatus Saccharimonadales bacterium]